MGKKVLKIIAIDTNIFIYFYQAHPHFGQKSKEWVEKLRKGELRGVTSIITKAELLSFKQPPKVIKSLKEQFESTPNLIVCEVNDNVAVKTAELRRKYGFRLPDAIQLATAIILKVNAFLTNDENLRKCKEIEVIVL